MITTIRVTPENPQGLMDEAALVKTTGTLENDNELTTWVEYREPGSDEIIHRSVHVTLKKWPEAMAGETQALA